MDNTLDPRWQIAIDHSHYLANQLQTHPAMIPELAATWQQPLSEDMLLIPLKVDFADDEAVKSALRRLRHRAMAHMALRDLCGLAPLAEIMESMTLLADVTTNFALDYYHRQLVATYGEPLDKAGLPQRLLIIGMGKLGGRELNVSSDVDYIFVYPEEGDTNGKKSIENYDFFTRLGKRVISALGDLTADGQVFRVDMRLRPNGDSGPLVCSLDALENYFITQGREWERFAGRLDGRAAADFPPLRVPQISRFRRDQRHARPARANSSRSGAQGHGRPRQTRPRRHPRD